MIAGIVAIILSGCAVVGLIILAGIIHYILEDIVNLIMIIDPECAKRVRFSDRNIEEKYPCTLILNATYDTPFTGTAYDFSEYEKSKIIGLIVFYPFVISYFFPAYSASFITVIRISFSAPSTDSSLNHFVMRSF